MAVNELTTRNAWLAFRSWQEREQKRGKKADRPELIAQMARALALTTRKPVSNDKVRVALAAYMPADEKQLPRRDWRLDYLEAFSTVTGAAVSRLTHLDYNGEGKLDEASYAAFYARIVGRHLKPDQIKRINVNLRRETELPGMFELVSDIAEALLDAGSEIEAQQATYDLIKKSGIYDRKPARGKAKPSRK